MATTTKTTYETKVVTVTPDKPFDKGINVIALENDRYLYDSYSKRIMSLDAIIDIVDEGYTEADSDSPKETAFSLLKDFLSQFKE